MPGALIPFLAGVSALGVIAATDGGLPDFAQFGIAAPLLLLIVAAWYRAEKRADRNAEELVKVLQGQIETVVPALDGARAGMSEATKLTVELVNTAVRATEALRTNENLLARYQALLDAR